MVRFVLILTFFCLFKFSVCQLRSALPQLYCSTRGTEDHVRCELSNVYLLRDHPRYHVNVLEPFSAEFVEWIDIWNQTLVILSPDFCELFPNLLTLVIPYNKIEIIDENAFTSCFKLEYVNLARNKIQIISPTLFRNSPMLQQLHLFSNEIRQISTHQFETNGHLNWLDMSTNELQSFPISAVKNCAKLAEIGIHTNNLFELDASSLVQNLPSLVRIEFNGNMFPCSQLNGILNVFTEANITTRDVSFEKGRPFKIRFEGNFTCVEDQ